MSSTKKTYSTADAAYKAFTQQQENAQSAWNTQTNGYAAGDFSANKNPYANQLFDQNRPAAGINRLGQGWLAFQEPRYVKGLLVGAGLALLLSNSKVQRALVKGAVGLWATIQGGFEEVKEQVQDIKSEMSMKHDGE